jgi:opacity protein-like surface antigen
MKKTLLLIAFLSISVTTYSQTIPKNAFYGGAGINFALVNFSSAEANTLGLSDVSINGKLLTSGAAGGPYNFPEISDNRFAPSVQLGYFQTFDKSKWLWGAEYTYSYIGSKSTSPVLHIPQVGAVGGISFTGDAVVQSFEYNITNQMTLTPYIGYSAKKSFFYLGFGPSLSQTKESINDVVGYAFIGDKEVNISGAPISFSATSWVYGIAATAGATYFFNSSLFLDFNYTFIQTGTQTNNFTADFSHSQGKISTTGKLIGRTSSHEITNSFSLTINKAF